MSSRHCTVCTDESHCGGYHVYVIELDPEVLTRARFQKQNTDLPSDVICFYVGYSGHSPSCRFAQHKGHYQNDSSFRCSCYSEEKTRYFLGRGPEGQGTTGGNRFVGEFGRYLRGRKFRSYNPIGTQDEAKEREEWLADRLREQGFGVYQK